MKQRSKSLKIQNPEKISNTPKGRCKTCPYTIYNLQLFLYFCVFCMECIDCVNAVLGKIRTFFRRTGLKTLTTCLCAFVPLCLFSGCGKNTPTQKPEIQETYYSRPVGLALSPTGTELYVANNIGNSILVIDPTTKAIKRQISVACSPRYMTVSPDGRYIYIAHDAFQPSPIGCPFTKVLKTTPIVPTGLITSVLNLNTGIVETELSLGSSAAGSRGVVFAKTLNKLFVTNLSYEPTGGTYTDGAIVVINTTTFSTSTATTENVDKANIGQNRPRGATPECYDDASAEYADTIAPIALTMTKDEKRLYFTNIYTYQEKYAKVPVICNTVCTREEAGCEPEEDCTDRINECQQNKITECQTKIKNCESASSEKKVPDPVAVVNLIGAIDTTTLNKINGYPKEISCRGPVDVKINNSNTKLYVSCFDDNTLLEISSIDSSPSVTTTMKFSDMKSLFGAAQSKPANLYITPDDKYLFVSQQGVNKVSQIDLPLNEKCCLKTSTSCTGAAYDATGFNCMSNLASAPLNWEKRYILRTYDVGDTPAGLMTVGNTLFVANMNSNSIMYFQF